MSDTDRQIRPFADWLTQQRQGSLNIEAAQSLNELVEAVRATGKAGTVTVTVHIAAGKGDSLEVTDKVTVKLPEHDRPTTLWFADDDCNLTRHDPNQPTLPYGPRVVDPETGEITTPERKNA